MSILIAAVLASALGVGFGRADITPPHGTLMPGYFKVREVKGAIDPLEALCVAFSDGETKALLMTIDCVDMPDAFSVGSVAFGGFPGEPFNDIGKAVKASSPFGMTILACLANGDRGYFPFSDCYREGGYESESSPFGPSVADDLIAGQLRLLRRLQEEGNAI